ncbi:uncharacterized protein LOC128227918 isoform X2 [Mya arenaria]|uniref:uncharacterized protein LOC128227918 isoform X2 n=1 Tax=Mya arenaria TaxID=6604 RepID=UPI0022DF58D9|nr:uncharacterized protein LOC128227918 isoform X2 [Mya arenaria]
MKPEFDLLLATSVRMDAEVGTVIYTVFVKDEDPGDKETLVLEMTTKNDFFAFDPKSGRLTVATDMTVPETGQTFDIEFKVTDRCGDETTGTLRIIVNYVQRQTLRPTASTEEAEATSPETFTTEKEKDKDNTPQTFSTTFTTTFLDEGNDDEKDDDDKGSEEGEGGETMKETGKDKPLGPGIIAGVAVAIVVVVIIIVVAIACIACKKTKAKTSPDSEKAGDYPDSKPVINGTREPAKLP